MHYLLFYEAELDYAERRKPFRAAHIQHARSAIARGELVLGGAFANPIDGAVLLFRSDSPSAAERFASTDPYVVNGVVTKVVRARVDDCGGRFGRIADPWP